jgi:hypothetical protein
VEQKQIKERKKERKSLGEATSENYRLLPVSKIKFLPKGAS